MSEAYNDELKKILLDQFKKKKEEYEEEIATNDSKPIDDDDDIEVRSTFSTKLFLESVLYDFNCRKRHNTDRYQVGTGNTLTPVYRRGDSFKMKLGFNRVFNPRNDSVSLIASYGPNASLNNGTKRNLTVLRSRPITLVDQWAIWLDDISGNQVTVEVFTPSDCMVGIWRFKFAMSLLNSPEDENYSTDSIHYILFNPWCPDDQVYMQNRIEREAHVLNDQGFIFQGTYNSVSSKEWSYGQFDFSVLPSVCLLLEKSSYPAHLRGSAAVIARALAAVINANDDYGLLVGNWATEFGGGTNPNHWRGSVQIYDQFLSDGGSQSVKYGQCWVFGGCITTACRALGLPCRTITCFLSSHISDESLAVKFYKDIDGNDIGSENSIWNYHVWNEVWMARNDLPGTFSGWQAIDATPQEKSKGLFRVGPAPLPAIHEADFGVTNDVPFVYSEVNADILVFKKDSTGTFQLAERRTNEVGILLATQDTKPELLYSGRAYLQNITDTYKYPEGSGMERKIFQKAVKQMPNAQILFNRIAVTPRKGQDDVKLTINQMEPVVFGKPFTVPVSLQNFTSEIRTVALRIDVNATIYTGALVTLLKEERMNIIIQPKDTKEISVELSPADYTGKLGPRTFINIDVSGTVLEIDLHFSDDHTFEIILPKLEIEVPDDVQLTKPFIVKFSILNPFPVEMTNCTLTVEAGRVQRPTVINISNVPVNGIMEKTIQLMPKQIGRSVIIGVLKSDHPIFLSGSAVIDVHF